MVPVLFLARPGTHKTGFLRGQPLELHFWQIKNKRCADNTHKILCPGDALPLVSAQTQLAGHVSLSRILPISRKYVII